ncbi:HlyU family transcriptional regulator [Halomonas sp. SpR8]|uniref:HlyU family transcriptional regulator n=1 Tax=Halomonas sp. SpR8 TaxID=3050463 RepID=UPI0027E4A201|nr:HlyU family transcriptional regulator [Halomonas sp. SpR8]MDQ7727686.1 HlyU family transcriptional regulator [Halomonas sp. SpR8]
MLKKIFSGLFGSDTQAAPGAKTKAADPVEYKGYSIVSQPDDQSGQFRVSGWISKPDAAGEMLQHRFERSDMLPGRDACDAMMVTKAQRYIDEVGEAMFEPDPRRAGDV